MAGNGSHPNRPTEADSGLLGVLPDNEPALPEHMRLAQPELEKRSVFARPIVAAVILLAIVAVGGLMVSSLEKVPVPTTVPEVVEEEGPTDFERRSEVREVLEQLDLDGTIAYVSVSGVSRVDLSSGDVADLRLNATPGPGPSVVLAAVGRSYVVDVADRPGAVVVETTADLVATATDGRFALVDSGPTIDGSESDSRFIYVIDRTAAVDLAPGDIILSEELSKDTPYFLAPGVGVVVQRDDGSSELFEASGSRVLSDHRVVAATSTSRVEVRCSDACSTHLVGPRGEAQLPDDFSAARLVDRSDELAVSISPDGMWLLLHGAGGGRDVGSGPRPRGVAAQLFDVESGRLLPVAAGRSGSPAWSDDSTTVMWLDLSGNDANLVIVDVNDRSVAAIDLDALGAPNRDGDALVVISGL